MNKPLDIEALILRSGNHSTPWAGMCLLEAASYVAGEHFSDQPMCVDPVLADFGRNWNDSLPDSERQQLKKYIPLLINTKGSDALSMRRSYLAWDWMVRVCLPTWLELGKFENEAAELRALPVIENEASAAAVAAAIQKAKTATDAARDAARDAAWAAARDAARAAARDAAWAAARAAAWAAARAARAAAWAAAPGKERAAADAVLAKTRAELQVSAHDLFQRMIDLKDPA